MEAKPDKTASCGALTLKPDLIKLLNKYAAASERRDKAVILFLQQIKRALEARTPRQDDRALPTREFAERMGVSYHTVHRAISHGLLSCIYVGKRPLIPQSEVDRIMREGLPVIPQGYAKKERPKAKPKKSDGQAGKPLLARPDVTVRSHTAKEVGT